MSPFLIAAFVALLALLLMLIEPTGRNVRAMQAGAVAALSGSLAAWVWPMHAASLLVAAFLLAALWLLGQALLWPLRWIGQVVRGH